MKHSDLLSKFSTLQESSAEGCFQSWSLSNKASYCRKSCNLLSLNLLCERSIIVENDVSTSSSNEMRHFFEQHISQSMAPLRRILLQGWRVPFPTADLLICKTLAVLHPLQFHLYGFDRRCYWIAVCLSMLISNCLHILSCSSWNRCNLCMSLKTAVILMIALLRTQLNNTEKSLIETSL